MGSYLGHNGQNSHSGNHPVPNNNHPPQYIAGKPSPKYIRSITVQNRSSRLVKIHTTHKSQQILQTQILPNGTVKIQKNVQKDGFFTVDAIIKIMGSLEGVQGYVMQA